MKKSIFDHKLISIPKYLNNEITISIGLAGTRGDGMAGKDSSKRKKPKAKQPETDTKQLRVSDLEITDEFKTIENSEDGKAAAQVLMKIPHGVVLVVGEDQKPEGVITAREFLTKIIDGENPVDLKVTALMNKDIMEIKYNALLDIVVPKVTENDPYAVIVTDKKGEFKGYFSPKDYQEALARINYLIK
jgi:signal-transduction protein with cAMP-binding, CBS, and nucleotidyltransferase domain